MKYRNIFSILLLLIIILLVLLYNKSYENFSNNHKQVQYYLISGPDENRKKHMQEQFNMYGIDDSKVIYIEGYNKDTLTNDFINTITTNKSLKKGEVSCAYKHYLALKHIVENNIELAVIMEDDIRFNEYVPKRIDIYLDQMSEDWNVLFDNDYLRMSENITSDLYVYKNETQKSNCASFYLINLKTAKILYDSFLPFDKAVDHYYNDLFKKYDMNIYWAEPPNAIQVKEDETSLKSIIHN